MQRRNTSYKSLVQELAWHILATERRPWNMEVLEEQAWVLQTLLDHIKDLNLYGKCDRKIMERVQCLFDTFVKFILQKCHSGHTVGNTLIGGRSKRENIIFCLSVNKICLSTHCKLQTEQGNIGKNKIVSVRKFDSCEFGYIQKSKGIHCQERLILSVKIIRTLLWFIMQFPQINLANLQAFGAHWQCILCCTLQEPYSICLSCDSVQWFILILGFQYFNCCNKEKYYIGT